MAHLFAKCYKVIATHINPSFLNPYKKTFHTRPHYLIILITCDKDQNGGRSFPIMQVPPCRGWKWVLDDSLFQLQPFLKRGGLRETLNHVVSTYAGRIHKKEIYYYIFCLKCNICYFFTPKVLLSIEQSKYYNFVKQPPRFNCLWNIRLRN